LNLSSDLVVSGETRITGSLVVTANTGNIEFNIITPGTSAWSTGGALITGRESLAGAGTQNAGLAFGGGAPAVLSCTEEYNGASWSAGGALITARCSLAGTGTQNEGLAFGGNTGVVTSCTEEYNGTSWTAGGALITARVSLAGAGTQNVGIAFGGNDFAFGLSCTEEYNGTSWTAGGALITAREQLAGAGIQDAALAFGGYDGSTLSCTEEYNGTSWSAGGALITARYRLAGAGTQNAGLAFGGYDGSTLSCTEQYNGTSWSAGGVLINTRQQLAGAGTQTAGLAFGGSPGYLSCTEEYTQNLILTKSLELSCSTGDLNLGSDLVVSGETRLLTVQSGSSSNQVLVYNPSTNAVERRTDLTNYSWSAYTVTWSSGSNPQPVLGNGTITGYYTVIGKTAFVRVKLLWGTTTSGGTGDWRFSLPVDAASPDGIQFPCSMLDNGLAWYQGTVNGDLVGAVDKTGIIAQSPGGFNSSEAVTNIRPFTWGNLDSLQFNGSYEIV
jgi:hypothetical protein